jgi:hypothetical protein
MSADPFANTTTVKNILQHIISPKIVSNGSGYVTKTDLVNVHNLVFSETATTAGTTQVPLTAQCGTVVIPSGFTFVQVTHSRVTTASIILATCRTSTGTAVESVTVNVTGKFIINLLVSPSSDLTVSWFIAAF